MGRRHPADPGNEHCQGVAAVAEAEGAARLGPNDRKDGRGQLGGERLDMDMWQPVLAIATAAADGMPSDHSCCTSFRSALYNWPWPKLSIGRPIPTGFFSSLIARPCFPFWSE